MLKLNLLKSSNYMKPSMAFFIEHANRDTTAYKVKTAFEDQFGLVVDRIDESITQDYTDYWKSFTIFIKESCVHEIKHMHFHTLFDRYILYYNKDDYWDVHLIRI